MHFRIQYRGYEWVFYHGEYLKQQRVSRNDTYFSTNNSSDIKLAIRNKKNKLAKVKEAECYNCGCPFTGQEFYCPNCGQKIKDKTITFSSFLKEVFNGFISWDAKFWTTIIPLLTKPGKVSSDYINGKRARYSNPFQFYLSVSILFFLIIGMAETYSKFNELRKGTISKSAPKKEIDQKKLDSIITVSQKELSNNLKGLDSVQRKKVLEIIPVKALDTIKVKDSRKGGFNLDLGGASQFAKMTQFQKKNPNVDVVSALDSLKIPNTLRNRFTYSRAEVVNKWSDSDGKEFIKQLISYASISLFVFLPIFTLFLKFIYLRRRFTYVEHLIFVFHTQTVFFLLLTIFFLINLAVSDGQLWLFSLLFLIYLFLAMKRFYQQGYIKTFFKFIILNGIYVTLSGIGVTVVALIAFLLS